MKERTIQYLSLSLFALLAVWGIYTLVYYLGIPYHGAALLSDALLDDVASGYARDAVLSRGMVAIVPILWHTLVRASPLLWYAILWGLVAAFVVGWNWSRTGSTALTIAWTPWKLFVIFLFSVWLLSTTLSLGSVSGRPVRLFAEPTHDTYNVSDESLGILRDDYSNLLSRGCLAPLGETATGAKLYNFRFWCMQTAFVTRVVTQMLFVLLLLFEFLVVGRAVLRWLRVPFARVSTEALFSVTAGACVWIVMLWCAAIAGIYTDTVGWLLAAAVPLLGWRHAKVWVERFLRHSWITEVRLWDPWMLLGWLLLSYLALNFLEVVRPFPIGWDDLGSYLNRPRLLVSYGTFIFSMSPFDWSYLASLGFLLFGYESMFGSTAAMMVNWSAGLLATLAVYVFARTYLGERRGLVAALLYYTLPLVGHFSFADMKIDNAVFLFGALAALAAWLALFPPEESGAPPRGLRERMALLGLSGAFVGFAFATKSTAIMIILPLFGVLLGALLHWFAFLAMAFLTFVVFSWHGVFSFQDVLARVSQQTSTEWVNSAFLLACLAAGAIFGIVAFLRRRESLVTVAQLLGAFVLGLFIAIFPWLEHNAIENGQILPTRLELSAPNTTSTSISIDMLPPELAANRENPICKATGAKEELDRYWGSTVNWSHYLTLPWRTVMNIDATGYYVTTIPALLLFPLLLLLPFFWKKEARWLRWLVGGTFLMIVEWMFLANGIPWYGMGIFLGLVVGLEALVARAPDRPTRILAGTLLGCSLFIAIGMRLWQLEQQRNIFEYSMGKVSADSLRTVTIPYYDKISATAVQRHESIPDRPSLYRIGTFIPYFIPKNLEVIGINDHQLDLFNCLYQERDPALTTKRLKALGFNSIVFDTNTATIEKNPQGSLHKKVDAFVNYVNNPASGLQVVVSDTNAGIAFILIP